MDIPHFIEAEAAHDFLREKRKAVAVALVVAHPHAEGTIEGVSRVGVHAKGDPRSG